MVSGDSKDAQKLITTKTSENCFQRVTSVGYCSVEYNLLGTAPSQGRNKPLSACAECSEPSSPREDISENNSLNDIEESIPDDLIGNDNRQYLIATHVESIEVSPTIPPSPADVHPCYCDCDCKILFEQPTSYCSVCKGYKSLGDDLKGSAPCDLPPPCPLYHKLFDPNKILMHTLPEFAKKSSRGAKSIVRDRVEDPIMREKNQDPVREKAKDAKQDKVEELAKDIGEDKAREEKINKFVDKAREERRNIRHKTVFGLFNMRYDYLIPSSCHDKCITDEGGVPGHQGWSWHSKNISGLKYRPDWRPGAAGKKVVQMLKKAKNQDDNMSTRDKRTRQKILQGVKKNKHREMMPLLKIEKKDRQYNVQLQTLKQGPRKLNEFPFEGDPQLFHIGRSDESNEKRRKKREREKRRRTREEQRFLQKSFKNLCDNVCQKVNRQNTATPGETPFQCGCSSVEEPPSCSCSDSTDTSADSETDYDEWVVEFNPPIAKYDPKKMANIPQQQSSSTQYNFEDYRVKLLDRSGNPVPRFFKGPDGKNVCSDLGGFYSPDQKWLQIGKDGYVGPDNRWVPNKFIGPDGATVDAEEGKFQIEDGDWFVIGVDGFVNAENKWQYYNSQPQSKKLQSNKTSAEGAIGDADHGADNRMSFGRQKRAVKPGANFSTFTCCPISKLRRRQNGKTESTLYNSKPSNKASLELLIEELSDKIKKSLCDTSNEQGSY